MNFVNLLGLNRELLWLVSNIMEISLNQLPLANWTSAVSAPPELNTFPAVPMVTGESANTQKGWFRERTYCLGRKS